MPSSPITTPQVAITGVGGYVPPDVLTNADLERMVDTSDAWITTRTGIKQRHLLRQEGKGTSALAIPAVKDLLQKTDTDPATVDLLICATSTPDLRMHATANTVAYGVGAVNAFSYDLQAACSSFLFALVTGAQFIAAGRCKKVIVVGADKMSSVVDYTDRNTCVLFGDGAGAVLLEPAAEGYGLLDSVLKADGAGEPYLHCKGGGSRHPLTAETLAAGEQYLHQEGQHVFKHAVRGMAQSVETLLQRNGLTIDDLTYLVPHQANKRIIDAVGHELGLPPEKTMLVIQEMGNTTNAPLPLCLWRYEEKLRKGDKLILTTFGAGFTWGAAYLTWAYDAPTA